MTNPEMEAARAKLKAKFESRIGGKGTVRRKQKAAHKPNSMDTGKLSAQIKKLGVQNIPNIASVNMFSEKQGTPVIHFKEPKVQASLQANCFIISGQNEEKQISELMPDVLMEMGADRMKDMQAMVKAMMAQGGKDMPGSSDDKADIPDIDSFEAEKK